DRAPALATAGSDRLPRRRRERRDRGAGRAVERDRGRARSDRGAHHAQAPAARPDPRAGGVTAVSEASPPRGAVVVDGSFVPVPAPRVGTVNVDAEAVLVDESSDVLVPLNPWPRSC